ncbi:MAG: 16S rRNA (adenine(1518)-N(6)/adenine(1519)-N(6))-dimethyltransferase RsmA [Buchnera aphidicola (Pentalonia nigronervosa)]|jgi:16S rRNA (adenine1518-N6/adenine1519-N6)-dimethyltransferase|uniref:Ribosomal RNA small subunit methyltransferase A n=1 Tax=Buchnera aphidicola (Pentalonia nigronervosa) TaxID=1309793 RepID=A0A7H1AZG6_9GAMM|nr:MAG: 16S rRNA (adenine(1518)-N(6)/adenine(1519)-N(6))-dimethyltransferase RsmA [Buchnera aphidicola (Pentalonia nigronervosa)]
MKKNKISSCWKCKKHLGQNFLINKYVIREIVRFINPNHTQVLVEIGPGLAALTKSICQFINELIVIEIDPILLNILKKYEFYSKLVVFRQDALTFNYFHLFRQKNQIIRIFGNLPYNISTSLIICFLKQIEIVQDMHFMLQKEVAERLIALPGSKRYGRLSIIAQYYCSIKILLNVDPDCFYPIPKVYSMFVRFVPHNKFPVFVYDINILSNITNAAFQHRRKMLHHSLKQFFSKETLIQLDISPTIRAENVSVLQYCRLANYIYFLKTNKNSICTSLK